MSDYSAVDAENDMIDDEIDKWVKDLFRQQRATIAFWSEYLAKHPEFWEMFFGYVRGMEGERFLEELAEYMSTLPDVLDAMYDNLPNFYRMAHEAARQELNEVGP